MKKKLLSLLLSLCVLTSLPASNVQAANRQLNVKVLFSVREFQVYGVPYSFTGRFPLIEAKSKAFYKGLFSITINYDYSTTNAVMTTGAENCRTTRDQLSSLCDCSTTCSNNGPFHHTNYYVNLDELTEAYSYDKNETAILYLTPLRLCRIKNSAHGTVSGVTFPSSNFLMVRDYDYEDGFQTDCADYSYNKVTKTLVHELGHLYGATDHYDTHYGDYRDDCIWGANKDDEEVVADIKICYDCMDAIAANVNKYQHT